MNTEDDTFRVLARRPLHEIYQTVYNQIGAETTIKQVASIVTMYGYTLREFIDYDELYTKAETMQNVKI